MAERVVEVKARGIDLVSVYLCAPSNNGQIQSDGPGLVLIGDTFESSSNYEMFARALCLRGISVAIPDFPFNSPVLAIDNVMAAKRLLAKGNGPQGIEALAARPISLMAHGSSADTGAKLLEKQDFAAFISFGAAPGGEEMAALSLDVLLLKGSKDCELKSDTFDAAFKALDGHAALLELKGIAAQSILDQLPRVASAPCKAELSLEQGHALLAEVVAEFVEKSLGGQQLAFAELGAELEGVKVESSK